MPAHVAFLLFDPNEVDGALVVKSWILHGPRAEDRSFNPQPGDLLTVIDDEEPAEKALVVRREGNGVWVQVLLPASA